MMTPDATAHDETAATTACTTCPIQRQHQHATPGTKLRPQRKLDIHTETTIVCRYCQKASSLQLAPTYAVTAPTITNILRAYGIQPRSFIQAQRTRRHSPTLHFPLSTDIPPLAKNPQTRPYLPHLIAVALLTEGAAGHRQDGHPYITFTNKAEAFHAIFADLIHYAYHTPPSAYYRPYWSRAGKQGAKAYYTTYFRRHDTDRMLTDLLHLTPTFRTRPKRGQTWTQYANESPQPTLRFILRSDITEEVAVFAIRLAMSAEGTISPMFRADSDKLFPHLVFACQHPILKQEWKTLFERVGIDLNPSFRGIESGKINSAETFARIGGFLSGIPVRTGSYYEGLTRQQILMGTLHCRAQTSIDRTLSLREKHAIVRRYAETMMP